MKQKINKTLLEAMDLLFNNQSDSRGYDVDSSSLTSPSARQSSGLDIVTENTTSTTATTTATTSTSSVAAIISNIAINTTHDKSTLLSNITTTTSSFLNNKDNFISTNTSTTAATSLHSTFTTAVSASIISNSTTTISIISTANITTMGGSEPDDGDSGLAFNHLYRVILECFVIMVFGYLAGRTGLINSTQASGIGTFVSKFSLPALLLKNMIELDFSQVNWMFLVGILIAKGSLFVLVVVVTLLVKHPINLGYAGIFAILATQSNDFAVGYPILLALYGESHKDYLNYLYLVAPISLVVLNPIGFTLLEINKTRQELRDKDTNSGITDAAGRVVKGVCTNPIVLMTFVGIIGHFVFNGKVPIILDNILDVLGGAYNATALFVLGLSMVGKIKGNLDVSLLVPILLIVAKTLILPLIIWEVVGSLVDDSKNGTSSLSMYGFIYGTIPTAPSVFLYASSYSIAEDTVARGIVLGTFLSAPLMFASGKMMTMVVTEDKDHSDELSDSCFDISIVSLVASVCVIGVFIFGKRWRTIPHRFTLALICSQIVACLGMITYYTLGRDKLNDVQHYPIIILLLVGVFSARTWTAVLSLVMCLLRTRSLCYVLRYQVWFWYIGFGVPVVLTGIIFMIGNHHLSDVDPSFHFGVYQTVVSACLLLLCIIVTISSIVMWQRTERQRYHSITSEPSSPQSSRSSHGTFDECNPNDIFNRPESDVQASEDGEHRELSQDGLSTYRPMKAQSIEDLMKIEDGRNRQIRNRTSSDSSGDVTEYTCLLGQCTPTERNQCVQGLQGYINQTSTNAEVASDDFTVRNTERVPEDYQSSHHLILLLLLLFSMCVGLFLCVWRLSHSEVSGIFLEMEFLDSFLNYGQGLIFLAVFGFDTKLFFSPLIRRIRRWLASTEVLGLPQSSQLNKTTRQICHQFTHYHLEKCTKDIVKDIREGFSINDRPDCDNPSDILGIGVEIHGSRWYRNLFTGSDLCSWLIEAGLATDKEGAVSYGRHLIQGQIIAHAMGQKNFQDAPYYYRFIDQSENDC